MVEFNKKIVSDKNVIISNIYSDMYLAKSGSGTAKIGGGKKDQAFLSRFTLPTQPLYGSGELKKLQYNFYVNDIELAQNIYSLPEVSIFKTRDAERVTITEGAQQMNEAKTKDIAIFTSHIEGFSSIHEDFSGLNNAGEDATDFVAVQRNVIMKTQLYTTPTSAYKKGEYPTGWRGFEQNDYTIGDYKRNYSFPASELGITGVDGDTRVIPVKVESPWKKGKYKWSIKAKDGKDGWNRTYFNKKYTGHIKEGSRDVAPDSNLYGDELTPSNSMFEIVRGQAEFFGEQTKGEGEVELLAAGAARLSTKTKLTGAQSGELYTYWKDGANEVKYPARGTYTNWASSANQVGAQDRQEVMICKKNIPYPMKFPARPYRVGEGFSTLATTATDPSGLSSSQDQNDFGNNIELDMQVASLAKAYTASNNNYTLRRAIVITFSEEPPMPDESLFEFMWKHRETVDHLGSGNTRAVQSFSDPQDGTATAKSFAAVAILNTDEGVFISQSAMRGEGGVIQGQCGSSWNLDQSTQDIIVSGEHNYSQSVLGEWLRWNFVFTPQTDLEDDGTKAGDVAGHSQVQLGSLGVGNGGNHCSLVISNPSDGELIEVSQDAAAGTTYKYLEVNNWKNQPSCWPGGGNWTKHMSIWNCNYKADKDPDANQDNAIDTNYDMTTQLFIDKLEFKDFNYEVMNPNMNTRNTHTDKIIIGPGEAFGAAHHVQETTITDSNVSGFKTYAPSTISFGATHPKYLGYMDTDRDDWGNVGGWQHDDYSFIYFHKFHTANLAQVGEIPTENMHAFYSFAGGREYDGFGGSSNMTSKWGYNNNCTYASVSGTMGASDKGRKPSMVINDWRTGTGGEHGNLPASNVWLNCCPVGLEAATAHDSSTAPTAAVTLDTHTSDNYAGRYSRLWSPIGTGDTLSWPGSDNISTSARKHDDTFSLVVEDININSSDTDDLDVTPVADFSDAIPVVINDEFFIKKEGMVKNWAKKGWMGLTPMFYADATFNNKSQSACRFARREAGPVSARVTDIVDTTSNGEITLKVDTVNPLQLEEDEQYIVYLLGGKADSDDFSADSTGFNSREVDGTANNAKAGLELFDIDAEEKTITFKWDGTAHDETTQLIKYDNLPFLCVSPYRYWMHINIDCATFDGHANGAPGTTLPSRTYDSFSVMDQSFPVWDGVSYSDSLLAEPLDATEHDIDVDDADDFELGDVIMIDDEAMLVVSKNSNTLSVVRNIGANDSEKHNGHIAGSIFYPKRTGVEHADNTKIKKVDIHSIDGERLFSSQNLDLIGNGNLYGTVDARNNYGSTYNEHTINHSTVSGVPGAYINTWTPSVVGEGGIYEVGTDFGYGSYTDEEDRGGDLSREIIKDGWNSFKMHEISNAEDFVVGKQIDLLARYTDDTVPHTININTRHNADFTPFALGIFEDEIPNTPKLQIKPNQKDPFFPEFTWESADDDLWYGLLHVDNASISSQYHNKIAHIPLNDDTTVIGGVYLTKSDGSKVSATAGSFTNSYEGLAGGTKFFNGTSDYLKFDSFDAISSEISVVVHITPDTHSGTSHILQQSGPIGQTYSDWEIYLDSSRQVVAKLLPNGQTTNQITLISSPIQVDGETPTAIILTFDKEIKSSNAKLYINGKLEDQSGLIKATHTTNNWKNDTDIEDSSTPLFIGCHNVEETFATGSITVDAVANFVHDQTFAIIDTAGTTHTFTIKTNSDAYSSNQVGLQAAIAEGGATGNNMAALAIIASVNSGTCASTITADTNAPAVVTLTQDVAGANGNRSITDTAASGDITVSNIAGGVTGAVSNYFDGRIEEIVIYNKCIYPIVPADQKFIFTKPLKEISNGTPLAYTGRLFIKDYHNIRGTTAQEVAVSSPVSYRKAGFRLVD